MDLQAKSKRGGWGGSITADAQVRRQLKAGRKPKTRELPSLFEAIKRLCDEADRGRNLMSKYGLDPADLGLALIYRANGAVGSKPLPDPGNLGAFATWFETLSGQTRVDFLGIMWWQTGAETGANGNHSAPMWITEFAHDERAALDLLVFKNQLTSMHPPK
jgi:hypothetical protein